MTQHRVEFHWTNTRGTRKSVMTIVCASNEAEAVKAARDEIRSDYGLTNIRLKSIRPFMG